MEEEPSDPHEQQLYQVFKSCLAENKTELDKKGLLVLFSKLLLEENDKDAILQLLELDTAHQSISFNEFKDGFLAVLGKSQEEPSNESDKEFNGDVDSVNSSKYNNHQSMDRKQTEAMDCQQIQNSKLFDCQRLQETWSNHDSITIEDVNSFCNSGSVLPKKNSSSKLQEQINLTWPTYSLRTHIKSDGCKDYINSETGHVTKSAIIELWELAGVSDANSLLVNLGFSASTINISDLSNALLSELKHHHDISLDGVAGEYTRLLKGLLSLNQEEVRNLNITIEHVSCERDKLRVDLNEANDRLNVLAQELDDQQVRMDKTHQEQQRLMELKHTEVLKDMTNQMHLESENSKSKLKSFDEQLKTSQQEEQRLRNELNTLLQELRLLETENQNLNDENLKIQTFNGQLTKQMQEMAVAHHQDESVDTSENEQVTDLMAHIKRLQVEMKVLRDHNDELTSELEMMKHPDNDVKSIVSSVEVRSTISDENEGAMSIPTTEVSDTEDEDSKQQQQQQQQQSKYTDHSKINKVNNATRHKMLEDNSNGNSINKLSEIIQDFRNFLTSAKFCAECSSLRAEVSSLISELELYQSSVPTIGITQIFCKKKKQHKKNLANELEAESKSNERGSESCRDLVISKIEKARHYKRISCSEDTINDMLDDNLDNLDVKNIAKNKLSGLRDYPPRKELESNGNKGINNLDFKRQNVEARELLREEELRHAAEKKQLIDRCNDLEKSLELLKSEYEQCEDYWASKLEEERQLFEQEQKISDEKFSELIMKMTEYEEQFNTNDRSRNDGRLSPIEERVNLEQQYNDLEDEFERWKLDAQYELDKKEREIDELRQKLSNEKKTKLNDASCQCPDEGMKEVYPDFHNTLYAASSSATGVDKTDSTVPAVIKNENVKSELQECSKCHKIVTPNSCDCHIKTNHRQHQQQQQRHSDQKNRRSGDGKRHHHHHHQKKMEMDYEFSNLIKQKEKLKQEIMKLQSIKAMNAHHMYAPPMIGAEEHNVIYAKLYAQEQRHKYMQYIFQSQQKENERILQGMWKQHVVETADLRFVIKATEDKLNHQMKLNKEQNEKLTKADFLTKELYVENAKLTETIKRLEEHCQILTQNRVDSTSA